MSRIRDEIEKIFPSGSYVLFTDEETERLVKGITSQNYISLSSFYKEFETEMDIVRGLAEIPVESTPFPGIYLFEGIGPGLQPLKELLVPEELVEISKTKLDSVRKVFFEHYLTHYEAGPNLYMRLIAFVYDAGLNLMHFLKYGEIAFQTETIKQNYQASLTEAYQEIRAEINASVPELVESIVLGYFQLWDNVEWTRRLLKSPVSREKMKLRAKAGQQLLIEEVKGSRRAPLKELAELLTELGI